ncbi:putative serine/threonine protein kinase, putative,protein kinase [Trypanosoma conorhini]|uniref:non-specific serine/threonine protein kinase n=1 Tax=Trypanosoma conorhini TaxID=83891 RepID=A0A422QAJ5_9TRYP|nr:putative serine/threonine protein kinase, putative,protein kinase [Trypanosoma conorhini]RNF27002.1 putative serine/threonine protein kinase, putative,protein kinase [Trypanosoma conorhini]
MVNNGKLSLRERLSTALGWLLSSKQDRPESSKKRGECAAPVPHPVGQLLASETRPLSLATAGAPPKSTTHSPDASVKCGGEKGVAAAPRVRDPEGASVQSPGSNAAPDAAPVDESGFFSFLEDVIAGNHTKLLKELNRSHTSDSASRTESTAPASPPLTPRDAEETARERVVAASSSSSPPPPLSIPPSPPLSGKEKEASKQGASRATQAALDNPSQRIGASSAARSLKDYELLAYLGTGTFAEVTLARHKATHRLFALKKISKRKVREEGCVQCTFTERQLLASLRHPFLVRLYQAFQSRTHLYLVLEFAQGGDMYFFLESKPWLREMRRKLQKSQRTHFRADTSFSSLHGMQEESELATGSSSAFRSLHSTISSLNAPLALAPDHSRAPIRLIAFYAIELALVLQYLHDQGFVYRDLKPENVLITREGHVMLTDFGVAKYEAGVKRRGAGGEGVKSFTGTAQYMSPEMLLGEPQDSRMDWWSFGCLLFEMATGRRPFEGESPYVILQAIVEHDVCIRHEDFLLTSLEIETRMTQLQQRYQAFVLQHLGLMEQEKDTWSMPEEEGVKPCSVFLDPQSTKSRDVSFVPSETVVCEGRGVSGDGARSLQGEGLNHNNRDTMKATTSTTSEDRAMYMKFAVEELDEACELLGDLIVSLLERRVERRLGGTSVLEHPFFSCPYVCSQMYYTHDARTELDDNSSLYNTIKSTCSSALTPQHPPTKSNELFTLYLHQEDATVPSGGRDVDGDKMGGSIDVDDRDDTDDDDVSGAEVRPCLSVASFLAQPPLQRPDNWRELFLEGKVAPLFVPRLFAADDLRYFPHAMTAMGDSAVEQQRVLREQIRRKNSFAHLREGEGDNRTIACRSPQRGKRHLLHSELVVSEEDEDVGLVPQSQPQRDYLWVPVGGKKGLVRAYEEASSGEKSHISPVSRPRVIFTASSPPSLGGSLVQSPSLLTKSRDRSRTRVWCSVAEGESATDPLDESPHRLALSAPYLSCSASAAETATTPEIATGTALAETKSLTTSHVASSEAAKSQDVSPQQPQPITSEEQAAASKGFSSAAASPRKLSTPVAFAPLSAELEGTPLRVSSHSSTEYDDSQLNSLDTNADEALGTLRGIAYDVEDYVPGPAAWKGLLLRSNTGIPTGEVSKNAGVQTRLPHVARQTLDVASQSPLQQRSAGAEVPSDDNRQSHGRVSREAAMSESPTMPSPPLGSGHASKEGHPAATAHPTALLPVFSPHLDTDTGTASPRSPSPREAADSTCFTQDVHPLPRFSLVEVEEMRPTYDSIGERLVPSTPEGSSSVGGGGGVQHYLGFTFDSRGCNTFLMEGAANGGTGGKWVT